MITLENRSLSESETSLAEQVRGLTNSEGRAKERVGMEVISGGAATEKTSEVVEDSTRSLETSRYMSVYRDWIIQYILKRWIKSENHY